jgi:hypothetical protein
MRGLLKMYITLRLLSFYVWSALIGALESLQICLSLPGPLSSLLFFDGFFYDTQHYWTLQRQESDHEFFISPLHSRMIFLWPRQLHTMAKSLLNNAENYFSLIRNRFHDLHKSLKRNALERRIVNFCFSIRFISIDISKRIQIHA